MISIAPYTQQDKEVLEKIFKSNMPLYFADHELPEFLTFLDENTDPYYVISADGRIVACGGIALGESDRVHLTWGMVERAEHKKGLGSSLLTFRIEQSRILYPGKTIELRTTQHAWQFFEKHGFVLLDTEKDFWAKGLDLYLMEFYTA